MNQSIQLGQRIHLRKGRTSGYPSARRAGSLAVRLVGFLLLFSLFFGCATSNFVPFSSDFDKRIAGKTLPYHFVRRGCEPYSIALTKALKTKGISCYRMGYAWFDLKTGRWGCHAVVLFRENGNLYIMDNMRAEPQQVHGLTDLEVVRDFDSFVVHIQDVITNEFLNESRLISDLLP